MELTSKKAINSVMAGIGIIAFAYGYYLHQHSNNQQDSLFAKEIVAHNTHANNQEGKKPSSDLPPQIEQSKGSTIDQSRTKMGLTEYQEMIRWSDERGYISGEDYQIYKSYSEQALKDLSDSGDVKAMLVLGGLFIEKGDQLDESNAQFFKAAVHGSTVALTHLASQTQIDMIATGEDKTPEGRDLGVTEILALYKLEAIRGDEAGSIANINAYKAVYKARYGEELVLQKEQLDRIDLRAKAIYDELLQQRQKLGLGDFVDSTPEMLKRNYSSK